ncbi:MAG: hypothetical protein CBB68_09905 [Rhodospirillaceae bacterium TMED8]|nr:alpha/beta hydrolase [Magnetovibrio sp.]OUT50170.1 MAG: hypothetical protein CBB68_09905 [Rhodospirillaceae bacterium TMED8]|tara:strand:+ start:1484 stop:2413 length:930 start_codon:yes stop_codon:yes gene_type:complete
MNLFKDFEIRRVATSNAQINLRVGGNGPPLLLIHGYPQTHYCWHAVAPRLAENFSVITPDLRGYGGSSKPPDNAAHTVYSKRTMAQDLSEVMTLLGHQIFQVVGHDRGARVGYRLALDSPERVKRFCSLDVVPTCNMWETIDKTRALGAFHWSFLAQPAPIPERMISAEADSFHTHLMQSWAKLGFQFDQDALAIYLEAMRNPQTIAASCGDYRAGASVDDAQDLDDRLNGRKIACPILFLWGGARGFGGPLKMDTNKGLRGREPLDIWRGWCDGDVTGGPIDCGHFLPEEAPEEVLSHLYHFLSAEHP